MPIRLPAREPEAERRRPEWRTAVGRVPAPPEERDAEEGAAENVGDGDLAEGLELADVADWVPLVAMTRTSSTAYPDQAEHSGLSDLPQVDTGNADQRKDGHGDLRRFADRVLGRG